MNDQAANITIFVIGIVVGISITVATLNGIERTYFYGQIDALTGKVNYCLDARHEWVWGEPEDGLRCEGSK